MIQRGPRHQFRRPVCESHAPLPELSSCSKPDYVAWRTRLLDYIARGATPRMVAERIAEGLDRFPGAVSLRGEMHHYAEMGDSWNPLDRPTPVGDDSLMEGF